MQRRVVRPLDAAAYLNCTSTPALKPYAIWLVKNASRSLKICIFLMRANTQHQLYQFRFAGQYSSEHVLRSDSLLWASMCVLMGYFSLWRLELWIRPFVHWEQAASLNRWHVDLSWHSFTRYKKITRFIQPVSRSHLVCWKQTHHSHSKNVGFPANSLLYHAFFFSLPFHLPLVLQSRGLQPRTR